MNYHLRLWLSYVIAICSVYCFLFIAIQTNVFSRSFYASVNSSLEIAADMNITDADYTKGMDVLLSYIEGSREDIEVAITEQDDPVELFNQKEKKHMVDVRNLYISARYIAIAALIIMVFFIGILRYTQKDEWVGVLATGFQTIAVLFMFILAALSLYASVDFTGFWTQFHKLFFSNDLWLLNPATDRMIQMLPEAVFSRLVTRIVFSFATFFILCYVASSYGLSRIRNALSLQQ
ncbi:MAG: TIGR01906 family membrane protein [Breznakia sp.]